MVRVKKLVSDKSDDSDSDSSNSIDSNSSSDNSDEEEIYKGVVHSIDRSYYRDNTVVYLWNFTPITVDKLKVNDKIIGNDGTVRTVLKVKHGKSELYKISQALADTYYVNGDHLLTLHMPDHKVIFWNSTKNGWSVLWWDDIMKKTRIKTEIVETPKQKCQECGLVLSSHLARHYKRMHPKCTVPKAPRKSPTVDAPDNEETKNALKLLNEFCESIPDNNVFTISVTDYLELNSTIQSRLAGVRGLCVTYPKKDVHLDPYVLGLWLGDGMKHGYSYACDGENDFQLIDYLEEWGDRNDATLKKIGNCSYSFSSTENRGRKGFAPLKKLLEKYDLVNNKYLPNEYIVNDRDTRLKVLAGIIDTDGTVTREGTRIVITQGTIHEELAFGIVKLARSLGFCCSFTTKKTSWIHKGVKKRGLAYGINVSGENVDEIPTLLPRKVCAPPISHNTSKTSGFITVTESGKKNCTEITVDGNGAIVINDHIMSHC